jgi:hypothetical protein
MSQAVTAAMLDGLPGMKPVRPYCVAPHRRAWIASTPMNTYHFEDGVVKVWEYADRMISRLILETIRTVFDKIISKRCYHLQGPQGTIPCLQEVDKALQTGRFHYALRLDIRGYFASIDRKILLELLNRHFNDPRLQNYFEQIVQISIIDNADITNPDKGIPIRSTLSNFFGALYLSPLDEAFQNVDGVEYFRFQDDILILTRTPKQFRRAQKVVFDVLRQLKLKLSHSKSKISRLKAFHFLGFNFELSPSRNAKEKTHVSRQIHKRTCQRALDKLKLSLLNAAPAARRQTYLIRWAAWWGKLHLETVTLVSNLTRFVLHCISKLELAVAWLARGLLPIKIACYSFGFLRQLVSKVGA